MTWFDIDEEPQASVFAGTGQALRDTVNGWSDEMLGLEAGAAAGGGKVQASYRKLGNRVSLLPIAQYCGKAAELSERYGAGRPAAMSTAFHARQAGAADAAACWARLTEEEKEEVLGWKPPATVVMGTGITLSYAAAHKETEIALTYDGEWSEIDGGDILTIGHCDMDWAPFEIDGLRVAFVGDIKKSVYTTEDGPESLQLHTYGWGIARKYHCDAYCTGIWLAEEGEWLWAQQWVVLDSPRGKEIWDRIRFAATHNTGEASTGEHCRHCWSRLHCPEHLLPAPLAKIEKSLAPLVEGGDVTLCTADTILRLQALEELVKKAKRVAQTAIERGVLKVRDPETGKIWGPVMMPGRKGFAEDKLRAELGDDVADKYVTRGQPYPQFRWLKPR